MPTIPARNVCTAGTAPGGVAVLFMVHKILKARGVCQLVRAIAPCHAASLRVTMALLPVPEPSKTGGTIARAGRYETNFFPVVVCLKILK